MPAEGIRPSRITSAAVGGVFIISGRSVFGVSGTDTRYTSLRWARVFAQSADKLLVITLDRLGLARNEGIDAGRLAELQMKNALDPHVNRRRLKDGWVA